MFDDDHPLPELLAMKMRLLWVEHIFGNLDYLKLTKSLAPLRDYCCDIVELFYRR